MSVRKLLLCVSVFAVGGFQGRRSSSDSSPFDDSDADPDYVDSDSDVPTTRNDSHFDNENQLVSPEHTNKKTRKRKANPSEWKRNNRKFRRNTGLLAINCILPDGDIGRCVPVKHCSPMLVAFKKARKPLSPHVTKQLKSYDCSSKNKDGHVCCPDGPIIVGDNIKEIPDPPDVSNHENLHLLPETCGHFELGTDKIILGTDAFLNEFPWMALLDYISPTIPYFLCGGSIINDRYILTAAHCLMQHRLRSVRVGEFNLKTDRDCVERLRKPPKCIEADVQDLIIEDIITHPKFSFNPISNDIALVRVSKMNISAENAKPICLPLAKYGNISTDHLIVTGWGTTDPDEWSVKSDVLQKVDVPVVDLDRCKSVYEGELRLTAKQMCAGGVGLKDSCKGDSGGPAQSLIAANRNVRYVQRGIVSFGYQGCAHDGQPSIYTNVLYYMDWILDTIKP